MVRLNIKYGVGLLALRFAPSYAFIFMDEIETKFLQTEESGILMFSLFGPMIQINLCHL